MNHERGEVSRRTFLRNSAGALGVGVLGLGTYVALDPWRRNAALESGAGILPALSRRAPDNSGPEIINPSENVLNICYDRFFQGKEELLPRLAWARRVDKADGRKVEGLGNNISSLAYLYFDKEKGRVETYDHFFERFVGQLRQAADIAKIDFITLMASLQVSGENTRDLKEQKADVTIGRIQQAVIPAARALNLEYQLLESLRPSNSFEKIANSPLKTLLPEKPIEPFDINAIIRFRTERTTGMMDWQPSMRAKALLVHGSGEVRQHFKIKYPDLVRSYQDTLVQLGVDFKPVVDEGEYQRKLATLPDNLKNAKIILKSLAEDYLEKYRGRLDIFAQDNNAQAAIGITDPLDLWQKYNFTDIWYNLCRFSWQQGPNRRDEQTALSETKSMIDEDFRNHRDWFYNNLMSQQILNPRFFNLLFDRARKVGNSFEVDLLQRLGSGINRYQAQAHLVREAYLATERVEGRLEYDSQFQCLATAMTTKMLSDQAGDFDPNERNSLYWHIFRTVSIREVSHQGLVVRESGFAPDVTVDPPYAAESTLGSLVQLETKLIEKGVIEKKAWENIDAFMRAFNALKDKKYGDLGNLRDGDKADLVRFFDARIVNTPHTAINRSQSVVNNLINWR